MGSDPLIGSQACLLIASRKTNYTSTCWRSTGGGATSNQPGKVNTPLPATGGRSNKEVTPAS